MARSVDAGGAKEDSSSSIKVAVHIRPLLGHEILQGCKHCLTVSPSKSQVQIGTHSLTCDLVYGGTGSPSSAMFKESVSPLVDGLFQGYNATVLAYGQTGSGKTYTMGTGFNDGNQNGLIQQAMYAMFKRIQALEDRFEFQLVVSFIEIHKEEVIDLLDLPSKLVCPNVTAVRTAVPGKPPIQIRESSNGVISISGCTEVSVDSVNEIAACLKQGSVNRTTGRTDMNIQSSRSHAIFTILVEQRRKHCTPQSDNINGSFDEDYLRAKLHLVDLAGSERAKKTGTDGLHFKEGVHINKGLLALGNVITALGDRRHKGVYVPYRDSKLTRLLQDSLGGNSRTLMVACVSPADINAEETLNTLKYANRTRNIQNKPVVNKDHVSSEVIKLRQQLQVLKAELSARDGGAQQTRVQVSNDRIASLEAKNEALLQELHMYRSRYDSVEDHYSTNIQDDGSMTMKSEGLNRGPPYKDSSDRKPEISGGIREFNEEEKKEYGVFDSNALPEYCGRKVMELENEKRAVQPDRDRLPSKTESRSFNTDAVPLTQKLELLEVEELRKQESQSHLLEHKEKSEEAEKHLQKEIQFLKGQKVQLQHKMKLEAEQYRHWKASSEKELQKLRMEGMRNELERRKLQAFNQRQKLVLQRKTEEAAVAAKRLKELLEVKKSSGRGNAALTNDRCSSLQCLLDHELEVMVNVHEVHSEYEKQSKLRAALAEELSYLKQMNEDESQGLRPARENNDSSRVSSVSLNARASRICSLESMLNKSSNSLHRMASQLSEAEDRERTFFNCGRWNQLRSIGDAKHLLQYLFVSLSDARCQLWDRDIEIREMKEQMRESVFLSRQNETQRQETVQDVKLREHPAATELAAAALQCDLLHSSKHSMNEVSNPSNPESYPAQRESSALFDQTPKMIPVNRGKIWNRKRSYQHQLLLKFKWKWEKPWKLSKWMKHTNETIMTAKLPNP